MSLLQTVHLEHTPPTHEVHIALYRDVRNAALLHQQLLAGNTEFEYAFVDAAIIISRVHALAAVYRAMNDLLAGKLRSRNVHSEIVFSLSGNNNIAESFRRFGITPTTASLLIIKISTPSAPFTASAVQSHLGEVVEGEQMSFEDDVLHGLVDLGRVRKAYKLSGAGGGKAGGVGGSDRGEKKGGEKGGEEGRKVIGMEKVEDWKELEVWVLGTMALRGITN